MFELTIGRYSVQVQVGSLPDIYETYARHAELNVEFGLEDTEGGMAFCAVAREEGWPFLVIAMRYAPAVPGFSPGAVLVPETDVLFLGAGTRLSAFDLHVPSEIWADQTDVGFWSWRQHGDVVIMSAESELAAWNLEGRKLWATFVEPPWNYTVDESTVNVDVMGRVSRFQLLKGPSKAR